MMSARIDDDDDDDDDEKSFRCSTGSFGTMVAIKLLQILSTLIIRILVISG